MLNRIHPFFLGIIAAACIGLVGAAGYIVYERVKGSVAPDCCKPDSGHGPGLHVGKWYRPARHNIGWSWREREWGPGFPHGTLPQACPLFCTERRGDVAILRGAVHGEILVPDCCSQWFVPASGRGDIGEKPGDLPKDEPEPKGDAAGKLIPTTFIEQDGKQTDVKGIYTVVGKEGENAYTGAVLIRKYGDTFIIQSATSTIDADGHPAGTSAIAGPAIREGDVLSWSWNMGGARSRASRFTGSAKTAC